MWGEPANIILIKILRAHFNSLAPCGANREIVLRVISNNEFQLTRPVWGEPLGKDIIIADYTNFNSLAPCGANRLRSCQWLARQTFQLTRPVWGEPIKHTRAYDVARISTHSPRVGRTNATPIKWTGYSDFNSLAPCGANHGLLTAVLSGRKFQLTRPVWGEPNGDTEQFRRLFISTHSPRVGRTRQVP